MAYQTPQLVLVGAAQGLVLGGVATIYSDNCVGSCQDATLSRDVLVC
jgi:hypothetical protein